MSEPSEDTRRLERLVRKGRLKPDDAVAAKAGIEALHALNVPKPTQVSDATDRWSQTKIRFLRHEISEADFRRATRWMAVGVMVSFGLLYFIVNLIWEWIKRESFQDAFIHEFAKLPLHVFSAAIFGWLMYVFSIRPARDKIVALSEELDAPIEPLRASRPRQCPTCASEDAARNGGSFMRWHWRLNPALAIIELLGFRVANDTLACQECATVFLHCPECQVSRSCDTSARLGNGICPTCFYRFPALRNFLGLALTSSAGATWSALRRLMPRRIRDQENPSQ